MIYLPKNYSEWIQVRPFEEQPRQWCSIAILVFTIKNNAHQIWDLNYTVAIPGLLRVMNTDTNWLRVLNTELDKGYKLFVDDIKKQALTSDKVLIYKDNELVFDGAPQDQDWYPLHTVMLSKYDDYKATLE